MNTPAATVFDQAAAGIAAGRRAQRKFYRRATITALVFLAVVLFTAWGNDYESCQRHNTLVVALNAESDNLTAASLAGITRAAKETDPGLVAADLTSAVRNARFAPRLRTHIIDCLQPVPGTG